MIQYITDNYQLMININLNGIHVLKVMPYMHWFVMSILISTLDTNITKFPTYAPTSCISTLSRWYSTKPGDDFGTIFYRQDILRNKRKRGAFPKRG